MKARRGKPLWSSWSEQFEEGCGYNPAEADDAEEQWAKAEEAEQVRLLDAELLNELNAEANAEDRYAEYTDFLVRVLRHIDMIPNQDHQRAIRCWLLKDFDVSPTFKPGGFPVGETLRATGEWLLAEGVAVREKDGSLAERPAGYLPGQLYPNHAEGYLKKGLGFCYATELWLTDAEWPGFGRVRDLGWDVLLKKCEEYVKSELKSKNSFTKTKR